MDLWGKSANWVRMLPSPTVPGSLPSCQLETWALGRAHFRVSQKHEGDLFTRAQQGEGPQQRCFKEPHQGLRDCSSTLGERAPQLGECTAFQVMSREGLRDVLRPCLHGHGQSLWSTGLATLQNRCKTRIWSLNNRYAKTAPLLS